MGAAGSEIVLVSEVFPPAIGGSGVLLANVYGRIGRDVEVMTSAENARGIRRPASRLRVTAAPLDRADWGLFSLASMRRHLAMAARLYSRGRHGRTLIHCGRAQPEAIPAYFASRMPGGPRYVFWAHGEEITTSRTSRDFHSAMQMVYRGAAAAIANSHNTAGLLIDEGFDPARILVVHPGVDVDRFSVTRRQDVRSPLAQDDELLLLSVGRLQRRKGHDLVLAAMAALRDSFAKLRYAVVGDGEERARLELRARELGVGDRVTFLGAVDDASLPALFTAADIFVLPTRVDDHDFEGFGIVFLEAAAAGIPAIGGRNGGVAEAVAEGETGLLVSGTDVQELASAITTLAQLPSFRRELGEAGRRRARDEFTWESAAAKVAALHDRLSAGAAPSRAASRHTSAAR